MAVLTTEQRKKLPKSAFAGPFESYPVPDKAHARNALARAKQQLNRGHISKATYDKIVAKARQVLGKEMDAEDEKKGKKPKGDKE